MEQSNLSSSLGPDADLLTSGPQISYLQKRGGGWTTVYIWLQVPRSQEAGRLLVALMFDSMQERAPSACLSPSTFICPCDAISGPSCPQFQKNTGQLGRAIPLRRGLAILPRGPGWKQG